MRILLCTPYLKQDGLISGGINMWANNLLDYYNSISSRSEIEIVPISFDRRNYVSVDTNIIRRIWLGIKDYSLSIHNLIKTIKQHHFDAIHICTSASISLIKDLLLIRIAKCNGIKSIIHFHFGRIPELKNKQNWEWKLLRRIIKLTDCAVVIDSTSYKVLNECAYENIVYLPNPVSPFVMGNIVKNNSIEHIAKNVLFVGHCVKTKGVEELVEACKQIPNIRLRMVGTILDDMREKLNSLADNGNWLEIIGHIPYEQVIKEMLSCDVFVLPTYTEGFPNVILESMACGCAIVTTPVGAIPEMLEEEDGKHFGLMVDPRNVEQLKNAIEKMLTDSDFKNECRINAQQRVNERYNIDSIWRQIVNIWSETVKN